MRHRTVDLPYQPVDCEGAVVLGQAARDLPPLWRPPKDETPGSSRRMALPTVIQTELLGLRPFALEDAEVPELWGCRCSARRGEGRKTIETAGCSQADRAAAATAPRFL